MKDNMKAEEIAALRAGFLPYLLIFVSLHPYFLMKIRKRSQR